MMGNERVLTLTRPPLALYLSPSDAQVGGQNVYVLHKEIQCLHPRRSPLRAVITP